MQGKRFAGAMIVLALAMLTVCLLATSSAAVLLIDDSLQGSTSGTRGGGAFQNGGWQVTAQYDYIYWHLPYPVYNGSAEFYVKGLYPLEARTTMKDKTELFHMYDYTFGSADTTYGGYRDNPYKGFIRKNGIWDPQNPYDKVDRFEIFWATRYDGEEPDSDYMSWDPNTNYLIREAWYPLGDGTSNFDTYRDGVLVNRLNLGGYYVPEGHSVRIAASTRTDPYSGAPIDGVYSYFKVYDNAASVPAQAKITWPRSGQVSNSQAVRIMWAKTAFSKYEVHITVANDPNTSIIWDSGTVTSAKNFCITGTLGNNQNYYAFVRLWNGAGWGPWSATGNMFNVNTSYVTPNRGVTTISGRSFYDSNAHYLGLGVTYMQALRFCKYDRDRFRNDCAYLAANGFNHIRILSMVGWPGQEIAPVGAYNSAGYWVDGWTDYWQQFTDCIDIAYDYGLRTEVTVFADAQFSMPNETDRYTHMDGIVSHIGGRDHKVAYVEVCNEYYQNGCSYDQVRTYGSYLNARTGRLIALSDDWNLSYLYTGSAADMATQHFSRDIGTFEGGWLPVRDPWGSIGLAGVPASLSSDEPIGPGASVNVENDPIKLVSAAAFAWTAGLSSYVYHTGAGVAATKWFEDMAGSGSFGSLRTILPPALSSWTRNDGLEAVAPFTVYCNGVANQYWTSNPGASTGCHRNIGARKDDEFVCYTQGVLSGGVTLQAREQLSFTVYNPMTGTVALGPVTKNPGDQFTLAQGSGAYIIKGTRIVTPICVSDTFTYSNGALNNNGGWYGSADSTRIEEASGMVRIIGGAGSYDAARSMYCQGAGGFIPVSIQIYPGTGTSTMWSLWLDDTNGLNLARWYGTATSATGRIGSTGLVTAAQTLPAGWSTLLVKIWTASNTAQFFFNGVDIGTLDNSSMGSNDILGRIRFESMDNSAATGNSLYFDNLSSVSDTTPPGPVTSFNATAGSGSVSLTWVNPGSDYAGTMIRFKTTGYPTGPTDGTQCYDSNGTSYNHTGLTNGTTYYYSAYAHDAVPNYSTAATRSATPGGDITPPGNVTAFTATAGDSQNSLSWTKPGDADLAGVKIMFKTTGYPTSQSDGTQCYNGMGTSYVHGNLVNGTTYYYKAFAYDAVPNYSSGTQISGVPVFAFRDQFTYANGGLNGNGGWSGSAASGNIEINNNCVRINGGAVSKDAIKVVSITAPGTGVIWVRCRINGEVGTQTIWSLWINNSSGKNFARWYGSGTSARGRIGNTGTVTASQTLSGAWQDIDVKINPTAQTSEFFFNGVSIGVLSYSSENPGNTIQQLRFERMDNSSGGGQNLFFDDLRLGGS